MMSKGKAFEGRRGGSEGKRERGRGGGGVVMTTAQA